MDKQKLKEQVVAEWNIFMIEKCQSNNLTGILEWFLKQVLNIAEQFSKHDLLFLNSVEFSDWQQHGTNKIYYTSKKEGCFIDEQEKKEIIKYYLDICNRNSIPTSFTILGKGSVYESNNCKIRKNNIIWLEAYFTLGECFIDIYTNSDIWLPNNLYGKEQKVIYSLNAPRLTSVLKNIDAIKGIDLYTTDCYFTKYVLNKGFCLENLDYKENNLG